MEGERVQASESSQINTSFKKISILVVDDDITCLSVVAAILKKWKYEVFTVKHAMDALCTLRVRGDLFDLVITDVHMPEMDGFQLQRVIAQEFQLPVVLMSADYKDEIVLKGLRNGASFFIAKPISPDDLRDLWQFAALDKKSKGFVDAIDADRDPSVGNKSSEKVLVPLSTENDDNISENEFQRESPLRDDDGKENHTSSTTIKKAKLVWTSALHNQFLEAIKTLGLDRAVPKKILEIMNVPDLTRENVASHLQKYRLFLKRVSDASCLIQYNASKRLGGMGHHSSSGSNNSLLEMLRQRQTLHQQLLKPSFRQSSGEHLLPAGNTSSISAMRFASGASNRMIHSGYGQSRVLSHQGNLWKPATGNTSFLSYPNSSRLGMDSNSYVLPATRSTQGTQSMVGKSSGEICISTTQAIPQAFSGCLSDCNASSFGVGTSSYNPVYESTGRHVNQMQSFKSLNSSYGLGDVELPSGGNNVGLAIPNSFTGISGGSGGESQINLLQSNNNVIEGLLESKFKNVNFSDLDQVMVSSPNLQNEDFLFIACENGTQNLVQSTPPVQNNLADGERTMASPVDDNIHNQQLYDGLGNIGRTSSNTINVQVPKQAIAGKDVSDPKYSNGMTDDTLLNCEQSLGQLQDIDGLFSFYLSQFDDIAPPSNVVAEDEFVASLFHSDPHGGDDNGGVI